jgi:hypothetical protein
MGLGDDRETVLGLAADHSNICRFETANGEDYRPVWKSIKLLANNAVKHAHEINSMEQITIPQGDVVAGGHGLASE